MAIIYQDKRTGIWQAPDWTSRSGHHIPSHSLGTRDRREAEEAWTLEQARMLRPVAASEGAFRPRAQLQLVGETFETALACYVATKKRWKEATRIKAAYVIPAVLDARFRVHDDGPELTLRRLKVSEFAGASGEAILAAWSDAEIARAGGRTHTYVKKIANYIKPALEYADRRGWFGDGRFPRFPEIASDYSAVGARKLWATRGQFLALAAELMPRDAIFPAKGHPGPALVVYPRRWAFIAVSTGMHASDVDRFTEADWDPARSLWYRTNTKGADHHAPAWFPARHFLEATLRDAQALWEPHRCARPDGWDRKAFPPRCRACGAPARFFCAEGAQPRKDWMGLRMKSAAKRAHLPRFAPIDMRRTFATWARAEGWSFDYVAHWLGNSSGMVREVYAQLENEHFRELVAKGSIVERELVAMLPLGQLEPRRGPKNRARAILVTPSKRPSEKGETDAPTARYQTKEG